MSQKFDRISYRKSDNSSVLELDIVAGYVETRCKRVAVHHNMVDSSNPLLMNELWLGFQYGVFGVADMFTLVGLLDFLYSESSAGMKALGTTFTWFSSSSGYFEA